MNKIYDGIMGLVVADAVGVPVEFKKRDSFTITDMTGYGTYNQPPGTWSDDSSMTLATLESIGRLGKIDPDDIMENFLQWCCNAEFTPYGEVFDIGRTTHQAIVRYKNGIDPLQCGGESVMDNGNGSLMRILPLVFLPHNTHDIFNVSKLTHAHKISLLACTIYIAIADELLAGNNKERAVQYGISKIENELSIPAEFKRLPVLYDLKRDTIKSSGYVVDTLEAAIWCLLLTSNYKDCILTAVNLGEDTDTVAAVAGGLAGILYGCGKEVGIPNRWISNIARKDWIKDLCKKIYHS